MTLELGPKRDVKILGWYDHGFSISPTTERAQYIYLQRQRMKELAG